MISTDKTSPGKRDFIRSYRSFSEKVSSLRRSNRRTTFRVEPILWGGRAPLWTSIDKRVTLEVASLPIKMSQISNDGRDNTPQTNVL
ncbi:hypothetical protein HNY73_022460 [Argiope bruennichi]|uniref:Uncharacterized protein n=1 Tax=Argiope bruennichi TaxID=94029 RepID=A0A8T0E571_ARGBR|nr:hypothetical protein HNY73_022460 [Argiope bruennichi]